jgi:hypothetical protein
VVRQEGARVCLGLFFRNGWAVEFEGSRAAFGVVSMYRQCGAIVIVSFADAYLRSRVYSG